MMYLDAIPAIEAALYGFVTLLFLVTGFLNLEDLQKIRQDKWTRQDTAALILRSLFFAFLLSFLLTLAISALVPLSTVLGFTVSAQRVLPVVLTSIGFSFCILLLTGVCYGIAKWKDWYDLIDEED